MLVWLNGRFVAAGTARVSALDRGLLHGDGVYDTWRTYGGEPFAVAAHLRRLNAAARVLGLPGAGGAPRWERLTRALVARAGLRDAAVRLTLTRGAGGDAVTPRRVARPTLLLTVRRLPADLGARRAAGVSAILLPFPRDAASPWAGLKLVGHPSAMVGRRLAERRGAAEGLYVNGAGEVTEATTANVFVVERDRLVTPPATGEILPGVTRAFVLRLARAAGVPVVEAPLPVTRVRRARELFLTASTVELLPIVRLDGRRVGAGRPGPIVRLLQDRYRAYVAAAVG